MATTPRLTTKTPVPIRIQRILTLRKRGELSSQVRIDGKRCSESRELLSIHRHCRYDQISSTALKESEPPKLSIPNRLAFRSVHRSRPQKHIPDNYGSAQVRACEKKRSSDEPIEEARRRRKSAIAQARRKSRKSPLGNWSFHRKPGLSTVTFHSK